MNFITNLNIKTIKNNSVHSFWLLWIALFITSLIVQQAGLFHLSASYHLFADDRNICGMHYGINILSNLSFMMVGCYFACRYYANDTKDVNLWIIAIGAMLVCLGSSYYHYAPDNYRLLWDRLPMSVVFSGITMYCVNRLNLMPFIKNKGTMAIKYLLFSISCVVLWYVGTIYNINLIEPYVFLQFGGLILLIYMGFIAYKTQDTVLVHKVIGIVGLYIIAKLFEHFDSQVFSLTHFIVSGHSIKHIVSALALYAWLKD